jgi:uncharacterized protein with HEPN domain
MHRDPGTITDIAAACQTIIDLVEGFDLDRFRNELAVQLAVQHQILVIGEATSRLSDRFVASHPAIPWHDIRAMRNFLIHSYDHVDIALVWDTVKLDIPALLVYLQPLVGEVD